MNSALINTLLQSSLINPAEADRIQTGMRQHHLSDIAAVVNAGVFSDWDLAKQLAHLSALPMDDVHHYDYQAVCKRLTLRPLIEKHSVLPLALGQDVLTLGIANPFDTRGQDECRFASGYQISPVILPLRQLENAIRRIYGEPISSTLHTASLNNNEIAQFSAVQTAPTETTADKDDAPVSRYLNQLLLDAVRRQASDIHIEPLEKQCRIRFRCDGLLLIHATPPSDLAARLAARLKILARLNIAERRLPQDGRFRLPLNPELTVDMRVSTLPAQWGEKVVLRLLDSNHIPLALNRLGYTDRQRSAFEQALTKPQGLILVTGPTGSGKTLSLYAGLSLLNQEHRNICTAEDPVEIQLPGINQLHIHPAIGLDFATALRTFLRQDPDVIMIGEIRDQETATMAVRAAQTGHLVLSTLHTNSAADTLNRLQHLGIAPYELSASLSLIIAQRLVRCLCPHCKRPAELTASQRDRLAIDTATSLFAANPQGCEHCNQGYLGRTGIFELVSCTTSQANPFNETALCDFMTDQADDMSLEQAGIRLLCQGITSLSELQRVLAYDSLQPETECG
ncbi:GspE/PulE family protein [Photobacterium sp. TLY01]|uniref:GspE/PulE family protein n=1 Tax=Photobacterium sp. TLY01 TaxID=2907534 RepID=UPI001F44DE3C|nr:ATPase, T2SS/T4P/T4SS family [Photobacterium sp. TLY01]UIP28334.1 Flp pilus assembly complex ATPase component TadA [Photobacterium sp. TLY01]